MYNIQVCIEYIYIYIYVYVYVYVCMYIYIYTYIHTYIHIYIYTPTSKALGGLWLSGFGAEAQDPGFVRVPGLWSCAPRVSSIFSHVTRAFCSGSGSVAAPAFLRRRL